MPSGYGSVPFLKASNPTSLARTAPKLLRLPASWAEEIHFQSRYPGGISVTKGAPDPPSACPRAAATRAARPATVAIATRKNVKCFIRVPPFGRILLRLRRKSTVRCDIQPCPRCIICAIMVEAVTVGTSQLRPPDRPPSPLISRVCPQAIEPNRLTIISLLIRLFQKTRGEGGIPD